MQAVEIVSEWLPDLIIIDVILPQMTGVDLAVLVKARFPACRVLLYSGQPASDLLAKAKTAGYTFEILAKPVQPEQMLELPGECWPMI